MVFSGLRSHDSDMPGEVQGLGYGPVWPFGGGAWCLGLLRLRFDCEFNAYLHPGLAGQTLGAKASRDAQRTRVATERREPITPKP